MKKLFALLLLIGPAAWAKTLIVPCDYASITNACAKAGDGDDVFIQPGICTISDPININRNVSFTIRGAGTNLTTLISGQRCRSVIHVHSSSTKLFSIHDLNCIGDASNTSGFIIIGNVGITFKGR